MTIRKSYIAFLFVMFPCVLNAQMLRAPVKAPVKVEQKVAPVASEAAIVPVDSSKVTAEDILKKTEQELQTNPVATISDAQLAEIQQPFSDELKQMIERASPEERRSLVKIMQNLQKTVNRRKNLRLPKNQQIDEDADISVNPNSQKDVEKYFHEKLVVPLGNGIITQEKALK